MDRKSRKITETNRMKGRGRGYIRLSEYGAHQVSGSASEVRACKGNTEGSVGGGGHRGSWRKEGKMKTCLAGAELPAPPRGQGESSKGLSHNGACQPCHLGVHLRRETRMGHVPCQPSAQLLEGAAPQTLNHGTSRRCPVIRIKRDLLSQQTSPSQPQKQDSTTKLSSFAMILKELGCQGR